MSRKSIKVYGERNTGTNYLQSLLLNNLEAEVKPGVIPRALRRVFPNNEAVRDMWFRLTFSSNLGWKHAMAPGNAGDLSGVCFITLTKNPYSWLLSMYRRPYHHINGWKPTFEEFLSSPWRTVGRERHPGPFPSPVALWNAKNASYLGLRKSAPCVNLTYEELLRDPNRVIEGLAETLKLPLRRDKFANTDSSTKKDDKSFDDYRDYYLQEKWRDKLTEESVRIINAGLDNTLLREFGYEPINGLRKAS